MLADRRVRAATLQPGERSPDRALDDVFANAGRRWEELPAVRWGDGNGCSAVSWGALTARARELLRRGGTPLADAAEATAGTVARLLVCDNELASRVAAHADRLASEAAIGPGDTVVVGHHRAVAVVAAALCGATLWPLAEAGEAVIVAVGARPRALVAGPVVWSELAAHVRSALICLDDGERRRTAHALAVGAAVARSTGAPQLSAARYYAQVAARLAALRAAVGLDRCEFGMCIGALATRDAALLRATALRCEVIAPLGVPPWEWVK